MLGTLRLPAVAYALFVTLLLMPTGYAHVPEIGEPGTAASLAPRLVSEDHEGIRCGGTAPITTQCLATTSAFATTAIHVSTRGTFTGEIVCTLRGPNNSYRVYYLEVVAGVAFGHGWKGPGLAPGTIQMQCTTDGLFGTASYTTGARYLGLGTWDVTFTFG